jgi:DNA (cytosine-5)-methyltransferase 1
MNCLSLCSGIGGIDLAAEWAGFEIVGQVEIDPFCLGILAKHWPNVKRMKDIYEVIGDEFGTIDLLVAGIPCQPYSVAGKRRGAEDDRAIWPQTFNIIKIARPLYILIENVAGFISLALDGVLSDLESEGYTCQPIVLPACAVNAPHRRDRIFILAHTGHQQSQERGELEERGERPPCGEFAPCGKALAHTERDGRARRRECSIGAQINNECTTSERGSQNFATKGCCEIEPFADTESQRLPLTQGPFRSRGKSGQPGLKCYCVSCRGETGHWSTQPGVGMLANGVSNRVAKLKALGNAVVPQIVYPILKAIADYEVQRCAG